MPALQDAWAAAVAQGMPVHIDLAASSSSSNPQQQLQQLQRQLTRAAYRIGKELASIAAANLCKWLWQLPERSKELFPLPQEMEEIDIKQLLEAEQPIRMPSKAMPEGNRQQMQQQQPPAVPGDAQDPAQQQQEQQQIPSSKPLRNRLIGSALHALGDSGSALLGLDSRSAQQQRHLAWRRGHLQRQLAEMQQQLQRVQALLDPTQGPALYPLPPGLAVFLGLASAEGVEGLDEDVDGDVLLMEDEPNAQQQQQECGAQRQCNNSKVAASSRTESIAAFAVQQAQQQEQEEVQQQQQGRAGGENTGPANSGPTESIATYDMQQEQEQGGSSSSSSDVKGRSSVDQKQNLRDISRPCKRQRSVQGAAE
jgi:hypothetical protein